MPNPRLNVVTLEARLNIQRERRRLGRPIYAPTLANLRRDCAAYLETPLGGRERQRVQAVADAVEALM